MYHLGELSSLNALILFRQRRKGEPGKSTLSFSGNPHNLFRSILNSKKLPDVCAGKEPELGINQAPNSDWTSHDQSDAGKFGI